MATSLRKTRVLSLLCLLLTGLYFFSWALVDTPHVWGRGFTARSKSTMITAIKQLREQLARAMTWTAEDGSSKPSATNRIDISHPLNQSSRNGSIKNTMFVSPYILERHQTDEKLKYTNSRLQKKTNTKLILFYNYPSWLHFSSETFQTCSAKACTISTDRRLLKKADAVMFHIFFFKDRQPPKHRPRGQIWVAFGFESPYALGSNMLSSAWARVFNWTMTYRVDSDIFRPYGLLAHRGKQTEKNYTQLAANKRKSVAWFVSHCRTQSDRMSYVKELQKHHPVDIFGKCGSHTCPRSKEFGCMSLLNSTYRFYLAFENSLCRDYVTEKFFKLFKPDLHIIPVVRGRADYKKYFPPGTFVDTSDFKSPLHLARHLKWLESQTDVYADMLSVKDQYVAREATSSALCAVCEKLHFEDNHKLYPSLHAWLFNGMCRSPRDVLHMYSVHHKPTLYDV